MSAIYYAGYNDDDYLMHHGTKGQKWGRRLYQNPDGSLTPLGRAHYGIGEARRKYQTYKEERIRKGIEKAVDRGDADTVYKYRNHLSQSEIQQAMSKIEMSTRLYKLTDAYQKKNNASDVVDRVTKAMEKGSKFLNTFNGFRESIKKVSEFGKEKDETKEAYEKLLRKQGSDMASEAVKNFEGSLEEKGKLYADTFNRFVESAGKRYDPDRSSINETEQNESARKALKEAMKKELADAKAARKEEKQQKKEAKQQERESQKNDYEERRSAVDRALSNYANEKAYAAFKSEDKPPLKYRDYANESSDKQKVKKTNNSDLADRQAMVQRALNALTNDRASLTKSREYSDFKKNKKNSYYEEQIKKYGYVKYWK